MQHHESQHTTFLKEVLVRAKVGVADFERHSGHFQRLLVSAELFRTCGKLEAETLDQCMDYNRLYEHIMTWETRPHTDLLETLAEDLIDFCFRDPKVDACRVTIVKPDIYHNASGAGICFSRRRSDHPQS